MSSKIDEIKSDLQDLNSLLDKANRQKSKDLLSIEIRKLQTELLSIQNQITTDENNVAKKFTSKSTPKCYEVKISNYAWDQTNEFVKIYATLTGVQTLPKESVYCNFTERSMDLHVLELNNKNYELSINNLCENIIEDKSYFKVKTDMIIVFLAKKLKKNWTCVTSVEKKLKEAKSATPPVTNAEDPNDSLMNLMKKMYQDGDDDLKRAIAKVWTEGQEKKGSGLGDIGDLN